MAARSGAEVAALDVLAPFVDRYSEQTDADDRFATRVMLTNGIPGDVVSALQSVSRAFRAWGARADVTRVLHEGDMLEFADRSLTVHHRPGPLPHRHRLPRRRPADARWPPTTCCPTSRPTR